MHGMAGLRFVDGAYNIRRYVARAPAALRAYMMGGFQVEEIKFENTDHLIDISEDEKACMITYMDFKENDVVQKCNTCKKVFDSAALDNWLKTRGSNRKCVHCQGPYNATTFCKGKAHLTYEKEEDRLIEAAEPQPEQQQGVLGRIMRIVGFGNRPHGD